MQQEKKKRIIIAKWTLKWRRQQKPLTILNWADKLAMDWFALFYCNIGFCVSTTQTERQLIINWIK